MRINFEISIKDLITWLLLVACIIAWTLTWINLGIAKKSAQVDLNTRSIQNIVKFLNDQQAPKKITQQRPPASQLPEEENK